MATRYPLRNLIKLSWWFSFCIGLIVLAFFFIDQENIVSSLLGGITNASFAMITFLLLCYAHIALMLFFEHKPSEDQIRVKVLKAVFLIVVGAVITYALNYLTKFLVSHHWIPDVRSKFKGDPFTFSFLIRSIMQSFVVNLVITIWHFSIIAQDAKSKTELENSKLKTMHAEAANQLLRQQIHPHFLFNALNILKSLISVSPVAAEEYLIHLSNFLRASVSSNNNPAASLQDEIKLSLDYLEMQKIRFGKALHYSVNIDEGALQNGWVLSFSLLPLLENAIKHNELTIQSPLHIRINQEKDRISVVNNVRLRRYKEASTGVGLNNLSERYQLWSGDEVLIKEEQDLFSVSIKIVDYANSDPGR